MSVVATEFRLRDVVLAVLDELDEADPNLLAAEVDARVPDEHLRAALRECLPRFIRDVHRPLDQKIRHYLSGAPTARAAAPTSSSRWADSADAYQRLLRMAESVAPGKWKVLGEMTRDEVMYASQVRITNGERSIAVGERYKRLAAAMRRHKVDVVADLPRNVLMGVFQ